MAPRGESGELLEYGNRRDEANLGHGIMPTCIGFYKIARDRARKTPKSCMLSGEKASNRADLRGALIGTWQPLSLAATRARATETSGCFNGDAVQQLNRYTYFQYRRAVCYTILEG